MQRDCELDGTFAETTFSRFDGRHLWFAAVAMDIGRSRQPDAARRVRLESGASGLDCLSGRVPMCAIIEGSILLQQAIDPHRA